MANFIKVDRGILGEATRHKPYKLEYALFEFMKMNVEAVKLSFGKNEYKNSHSAYTTYHKAVRRFAFPVRVVMRKGEVYLVRTDM